MSQQLDREALVSILEAEDIGDISFSELIRLFREDKAFSSFLPDGVYQVDPRKGDRVLYHSSRGRRPHDNRPSQSPGSGLERGCAICQGRTTGVIDVADLSQGFTFINKNLFPVLFPYDNLHLNQQAAAKELASPAEGRSAYGFHFLQWTSSQHDRDWHNMPLSDGIVVMKRLAALEEKLINESREFMPAGENGEHGFILIVKNHGHLVGGSLAHGHQQIALSNAMPRSIRDNRLFERKHGELFSAYLLRENPPGLAVRDYGPAILLVPYFMRRPFDMMLLLKEVGKRYLHQLTEHQISVVTQGWRDAIRLIRAVMSEMDREIAYNVITHNGPGAGLYFEFLPYTQETGGAEHLGLFVCQYGPKDAAMSLRKLLQKLEKG
jgi:galactose-1-phosphate uridylyltransferase